MDMDDQAGVRNLHWDFVPSLFSLEPTFRYSSVSSTAGADVLSLPSGLPHRSLWLPQTRVIFRLVGFNWSLTDRTEFIHP